MLGESDTRGYHVTLWSQPLHRWLAAWVYHKYDMTMFRLPGFLRLENWLLKREERKNPHLVAIPLGCKQDIRCYDLSRKGRDDVVTFEVTKEQYDRLKRSKLDDPVAQ